MLRTPRILPTLPLQAVSLPWSPISLPQHVTANRCDHVQTRLWLCSNPVLLLDLMQKVLILLAVYHS